jgi:hypothetical protein
LSDYPIIPAKPTGIDVKQGGFPSVFDLTRSKLWICLLIILASVAVWDQIFEKIPRKSQNPE